MIQESLRRRIPDVLVLSDFVVISVGSTLTEFFSSRVAIAILFCLWEETSRANRPLRRREFQRKKLTKRFHVQLARFEALQGGLYQFNTIHR